MGDRVPDPDVTFLESLTGGMCARCHCWKPRVRQQQLCEECLQCIDAALGNVETYEDALHPLTAVWPPPEEQR